MIKLYHGSWVEVNEPLAKAGRRNLDFGQGFYLTKLRQQAEHWSEVIAGRRGRSAKPVVSVFCFDYEGARRDGVRFLEFPEYNLDWLDYVVECRRGKDVSSEYDIVEGGIANDNVIDTVEDYEKGVITAEQALGQLQYKEVNHQLCILTQAVIDRYLRFTESYSPEQEEQ